MIRKLSFKVTQPCDGNTFEHIVLIDKYEVHGAENIRPVVDNISLPNLMRRITSGAELSGKEGPYEWVWIT